MVRKIKRNKKGVSEMVGYVILLTIGIIMGLLVYTWLSTYVPKEAAECPDGVSISVDSLTCGTNQISFYLKNNGLFKIDGYYIYATTNSLQDVATKNLIPTSEGDVINVLLDPGKSVDETQTFALDESIYSVEITPMRIQPNAKGVLTFVQCSDAKVIEKKRCDYTAT